MVERGHEQEIASIRRRLAELGEERAALELRLNELSQPAVAAAAATVPGPGDVTAVSPVAVKVALFRSLFAGRADVFPVRWENAKADRAGLRQRVGHGRLRQAPGEGPFPTVVSPAAIPGGEVEVGGSPGRGRG